MAIKPLGFRIGRHLDEVGFHTHVIASYKMMETPPWKLIVHTVCFDLCKYKKSENYPTLYCLYYSELLEYCTDYTHIFTDGSKDGDKTAAFICQSFGFSKRLPNKASIFTAELEAIVSALRCINITSKNNTFVFVALNMHCRPCCPSGIIPQLKLLRNFTFSYILYIIIFCWLSSHMGIYGKEHVASAVKAELQKDVSEYVISYTDAYQYISQYVRELWQSEWETAVNNKLLATKPLIGEQPSAYRSVRRDEVVLSRLRLGHSYLTHSYLLNGATPGMCYV